MDKRFVDKRSGAPLSGALAEEESRLVAAVEFWRHRVRVEYKYICGLKELRAILSLGGEDRSLNAAIKDMDLNLASEILQRERGLVKLEKASKDLRSQFYGVTYGSKGVVLNTFEPLSFEKEVQWLQMIEKKILKHDRALSSARAKASTAIELIRKGVLHTREEIASQTTQKLAYKVFDDADLACRRETVLTNEVIDELRHEVAKSFNGWSTKEHRCIETLKDTFATFAGTQVDLAGVLNSSGVCSQLAASNISISVETSMLHCAMENTLDHPLFHSRRYVNFEFGRWTPRQQKGEGQSKYMILFGRPLLDRQPVESADPQVIAAIHTLARAYTTARVLEAPQYSKDKSREIQKAAYEFEGSRDFQAEPPTSCSHLLMYFLDRLPDGPMLPSTSGSRAGVDKTLLEQWKSLLGVSTTRGNILSAIYTTLCKHAEELNWGVRNPALQVWSKILVGSEGFEKTVLAFLRPTLQWTLLDQSTRW